MGKQTRNIIAVAY